MNKRAVGQRILNIVGAFMVFWVVIAFIAIGFIWYLFHSISHDRDKRYAKIQKDFSVLQMPAALHKTSSDCSIGDPVDGSPTCTGNYTFINGTGEQLPNQFAATFASQGFKDISPLQSKYIDTIDYQYANAKREEAINVMGKLTDGGTVQVSLTDYVAEKQ